MRQRLGKRFEAVAHISSYKIKKRKGKRRGVKVRKEQNSGKGKKIKRKGKKEGVRVGEEKEWKENEGRERKEDGKEERRKGE